MPTVQTWSGKSDVYVTEKMSTVKQQSLKGTWKGVSTVDYHDRSVNLASPNGLIWPSSELILEQIRFFVEACDQFQGFHVSWDPSMEWGLLLKESLTALRDLYPKQKIITFHLSSTAALDASRSKAVEMLSLVCTWDASDLVIPLCQPLLDEEVEESSVIFAKLMDNVTLPYRCGPAFQTSLDMDGFCQLYSTGNSSRILQVSSMMEPTVGRFLKSEMADTAFWSSCCPWMTTPYDSTLQAEHITLRGCPAGWTTEKAKTVLMQSLSLEGTRRLCRTCIFPHAYPANAPFLSRAMSSHIMDRTTLQLCADFLKQQSTVATQRLLSQWELPLSDCIQLHEALSEKISPSSDDVESS